MSALDITFPGNLSQVVSLAVLRQVPSALLANGELYFVGQKGFYSFDPTSVAPDDNDSIIRPNDLTSLQPGRWIIVGFGEEAVSLTRSNLAALKAASTDDGYSLYDGDVWQWAAGDYSATPASALDKLFVKADTTSLASGAWLRSVDTVSVRKFGAKGDGATDDKAAFQDANGFLAVRGGGTISVPIGDYPISSVVTLHPRVSVRGMGDDRTIIRCSGSGFISTSAAGDKGMTVFQGFRMIGAGRTTGTAIAIAMSAAADRIQGVRFRDVQIEGFSVGIQGRSMWDSRIEGCRIINVTYGVRLEGQCVSPCITGCQIVSEGSVYNDGSMGIYVDQYVYSDSVTRRPEAVLIDGETRVFGFDTNVWLNRALVASVINSDLDGALRIGVRVSTVDYKAVITNNYLAAIHDSRGVTIVQIDALAAANPALVSIRDNSMSAAGVYNMASTAIAINGANRTGKISVRDNNVGLGSGVGTALYLNTATGVDAVKNYLAGQVYSINKENLGGHLFDRNTLNGPIRRVGSVTPDRFVENVGSAVTGYVGLVTIPASLTTVTISLSSLGLPANPVIGTPANLVMIAKAMQISGSADRGLVRAYYDGAGNVVVKVATAFGADSSDVNLELTAQ